MNIIVREVNTCTDSMEWRDIHHDNTYNKWADTVQRCLIHMR